MLINFWVSSSSNSISTRDHSDFLNIAQIFCSLWLGGGGWQREHQLPELLKNELWGYMASMVSLPYKISLHAYFNQLDFHWTPFKIFEKKFFLKSISLKSLIALCKVTEFKIFKHLM